MGIGYDFVSFLATDLEFSYRPSFEYEKFQTAIANSTTPGQIGNTTRHFELDVSSIVCPVYLNGHGTNFLSWEPGCFTGVIYPVLGGGIGISQFEIYNFRSTGLPPFTPAVPAFFVCREVGDHGSEGSA